jgi:acyl phosphate:glycerol-3-phosphate acyltransferase
MDDLIEYLSAYLIGSIPVGSLLFKFFRKVYLRKTATGIGEAEVWKVAGSGLGMVMVVLDILKGASAVFLAHKISPVDPPDMVVAGFLVLMGDQFPIFLKFKGNRNLCTLIGVFAALLACLMVK